MLERDFDNCNALEGMLLSEIFEHLTSLGGLWSLYEYICHGVILGIVNVLIKGV